MTLASVRERVALELDTLSEAELNQVAEYVAFLRFRARIATPPRDDAHLRALYAEAAAEDRTLAEEGMAEYHRVLDDEDQR